MDNSKYVDLHKIAAIFRGIQEEEYAKNNEEVAELDNTMEDAVEEDNAFNTAAAKAALAGEKEFSFKIKTSEIEKLNSYMVLHFFDCSLISNYAS